MGQAPGKCEFEMAPCRIGLEGLGTHVLWRSRRVGLEPVADAGFGEDDVDLVPSKHVPGGDEKGVRVVVPTLAQTEDAEHQFGPALVL
jgi:hypothetical protein